MGSGDFFATEMGDQFLFCKEQDAIFLFINPDIKMGLFRRISN